MKIISRHSGYGRYTVRLEGEEVNYSDMALITLVDNIHSSEPLKVIKKGNMWVLSDNSQVCHFGGKVVRKLNQIAEIIVYVD